MQLVSDNKSHLVASMTGNNNLAARIIMYIVGYAMLRQYPYYNSNKVSITREDIWKIIFCMYTVRNVVCPTGLYGTSCMDSCPNCRHGTAPGALGCFRNGTCVVSGCKTGWTNKNCSKGRYCILLPHYHSTQSLSELP